MIKSGEANFSVCWRQIEEDCVVETRDQDRWATIPNQTKPEDGRLSPDGANLSSARHFGRLLHTPATRKPGSQSRSTRKSYQSLPNQSLPGLLLLAADTCYFITMRVPTLLAVGYDLPVPLASLDSKPEPVYNLTAIKCGLDKVLLDMMTKNPKNPKQIGEVHAKQACKEAA